MFGKAVLPQAATCKDAGAHIELKALWLMYIPPSCHYLCLFQREVNFNHKVYDCGSHVPFIGALRLLAVQAPFPLHLARMFVRQVTVCHDDLAGWQLPRR
jgi:hypothetical protein